MNDQPHFDLVDQPWIPVLDQDRVREVSLREALVNAQEFRGLDTAEPLEAVAMLRQALLPVLFDACGLPRSEREWGERWAAGSLDAARIDEYLDRHRDRFDLFHPVAPFAQVAGLEASTGEVKPISALALAMASGNNVPLFASSIANDPPSLSCPEVTRTLLAAHCFDTAGVKSAAVGDSLGKKGKSWPGLAPLGNLGVVIPTGRNLAQTLLLNTPIVPQGLRVDDLPQWRQPPHSAKWTTRGALGLMDLMTFQARRIRLMPDVWRAVQAIGTPMDSAPTKVTVSWAVLCAGDRLSPLPEYEPHTQWKEVDKTDADGPARRPVLLQSGRAAWRGLAPLLASTPTADGVQTSLLLAQAHDLQAMGFIDANVQLEVQTTGVAYGAKSAVIENVISDAVPLPVAALRADSEVRGLVLEVVDQSERLRKAANDLDDTLRRASGGAPIPWDKSQRLGDVLIGRLGGLAHRLLLGLQRSPDLVDEAETAWLRAARSTAFEVAELGISATPSMAFLGRPGRNAKYPDRASDAEARFRATVNKILPRRDSDNDLKGVSS